MVIPVVFAGGVGAAAPQIYAPTPALRGTVISPVAAVTVAGSGLSGPAVVAVERPPTSLHIVAATVPAPPPSVMVNSPGALGIPAIALSAYRNAAQLMAASYPDCGLSWNLLAGIGRIESMHASGGGADARGIAVPPIYGPALDGTLAGNEVIFQSSIGGQATYARAMGPMQFLPGTWARYASDGDGDGTADPQNLYDSTLAAARYLCSGGLDLRDPSQAMSAILRYNNSMPYAQNVLGWAAAYATGVVPVDLPPITGSPPPLGDKHPENSEGIGSGLPPTDPLAQMPLIDVGQSGVAIQPPMWPSQSPSPGGPACTLICIGRQDPLPTQQPPWVTLPPPDAPLSPPPQTAPPAPSTGPPSAAVPPTGPAANTPPAPGPMPGTAG
ncbi:MAG: lytic transglycosylase domain-containing protein [Mycobacterium sp.]